MPSQSSITVTPGALRGTNTITLTGSWAASMTCMVCTGIQCAKMAPVQ